MVIKQIVSDRGLEAGMNMNSIKQSLYWMFIIIPHSEKEKVNYSLLICDFTQVNTSVERESEVEEMKMLTAAQAITTMILCRQGHIFCLTSESTTIIKSSFGCNSSNKHFMSPLIQLPIQCLWSGSRLYILMTSEMSLAPGLWRFVHAYKY